MAIFTSYIALDLVLAIIAAIVGFYLNFKLRSRKYWAHRNIPYEEPTFFFGNMMEANIKKDFGTIIGEIYSRNVDKKLVGIWMYGKPGVVVTDVDLLKNILVKDFSHFHDRGININEELEPLSAHLFNLNGQRWRNLRVKLTPTFTSGKMKMMFETMLDVGHQLEKFLEKPAAQGETVEIKEILASFTTDTIASCAFGLETKSLGNPKSEFRHYGRMIFELPAWNLICGILLFVAPWTMKILPLRQFPKEVCDFFMKAVKDVMEHRDKTNLKRKDFMDLLLQLKNKGFIEDADSKFSESPSLTEKFTAEEAAAQAFVFFFAGFETSSTTLMFACYELAKNPDIQDQLQAEIDRILEKENGKISYYALHQMEYLEQVVQETLRLHPPVPAMFRECTKRYNIPGTDMTLEEGDFLLLPFKSIQCDSRYFPNPNRFDPDRYSKEFTDSRDSFLNLAFGNGPRNCIGSRFGIQQVKVGLVSVLSKYRLEVAATTPTVLKLDPTNFIPSPIGGMPVRITKRQI